MSDNSQIEKKKVQQRLQERHAGLKRRLGISQSVKLPSRISAQRIDFLIEEVKDHGFEEIADTLSPRLRELLLRICQQRGVSLIGEDQRIEQQQQLEEIRKEAERLEEINRQEKKEQALFSGASMHRRFNIETPISILFDEKRNEIEKNNSYLQFVLNRTEEKAFEQYFDSLRNESKNIDEQARRGLPLTPEQMKVQELRQLYGLSFDKNQEAPSQEQLRNRNRLSLNDLPKEIGVQAQSEKKRYVAICLAKNESLELATILYANEIYQGNHDGHTQEDLARRALEFTPRGQDRSFEEMQTSRQQIAQKLSSEKEKTVQIKEAKQRDISERLEKAMKRESQKMSRSKTISRPKTNDMVALMKAKSGRVSQTTRPVRRTFLNEPMMQEILRDRQAQRR